MRRSRSTLHALLCAAALLVQATLLPLAHSRHETSTRGVHAVRIADAQRVTLRQAAATDVHDAAACPLCATVAHGRVGLKPLGVAIALVARPLWAVHGDVGATVDRPAHAAGGPRAPPLFSA